MDAYWFVDQPRTGAMNMAIDHAMASLAGSRQIVLLRLYQWMQPTLSLGYFQSIHERLEHKPSLTLPLVRRATGGGAIVHHHDWTYSLSVPDRHDRVGPATELYEVVHDALVGMLQDWGYPAQKWAHRPDDLPRSCEVQNSTCHFLCFERRSASDIVVGNGKVLGSAQRRISGAIIQHGSLLMQTSEFAPSLVGLRDLPCICKLNRNVTGDDGNESIGQELAECISGAAADKWHWSWTSQLSDGLIGELAGVSEGHFASRQWTAKR